MKPPPDALIRHSCRPWRAERGGLLVTAMLLAAVIAVMLAGYLGLTRHALRMSQRTFLVNDAFNLAEAGLEEALYSFNQMSSGSSGAWTGWTIDGNNARRTLPTFNRGGVAIGVVKLYVAGHDGSVAEPYVIAQARITPIDGGPPITRTLQYSLRGSSAYSANGLVGLQGITFKGQGFADSFNSNPLNLPYGPWLPYSRLIGRANTRVIVPTGTFSLGNGMIYGDVLVGPGVASPPASQVTGEIQSGFAGGFRMPTFPAPADVNRSYDLGATLPAVLPRFGDLPASDGKFYYFCNGANITNVSVLPGVRVAIIGRNTSMGSGLTLHYLANAEIYIDGPVVTTGEINNLSWAGALQIFTTTSAPCAIGNNDRIVACLYAPNAPLTASGGGKTGMLVGYFLAKTITVTGHMEFHYDEALKALKAGAAWQLTQWLELRTDADMSQLATLTKGFLD